MADITATTLHYLMAGDEYFWQWDEEGEVIVWRNHTTIAFRDELIEVLEPLAERGLPPFGAVLLVLAACRDSWLASSAEAGILQGVGILANGSGLGHGQPGIAEVLTQLDCVARLPAELRRGTAARAALLGLLFESGGERFSRQESRQVLQALRDRHLDATLVHQIDPVPVLYRLTGDLRALRSALRGLTAEMLELRIRTSVDVPLSPAELRLPPPAAGSELLDELAIHPETAGLARLTRRLIGLLRLPRHRERPGALPIDGFADITNRGDPHRLLLSELAMDDLTLTTRMANREALYLRREAPPEPQPPRRRVLLDAGIRLWGRPRLLAMAVALAVVELDRDAIIASLRDGRFEPVSLGDAAAVKRQLEVLEAATHPGEALARLLPEEPPTPAAREDLLVTHREVLHDPEFLTCWQALGARRPALLVLLGDHGEVEVQAVNGRGRQRRQRARLELERLLGAPPPAASPPAQVAKTGGPRQLPAILSRAEFPLFLPAVLASGGEPAIYLHDLGTVGVTRDRRLMHWAPKSPRYGRQLLDMVPPADAYWVTMSESGQIAVLAAQRLEHGREDLRLLVADLNERVRELFRLGLSRDPVRYLHRVQETLLLFGGHGAQAIDINTGRIIDRTSYGDNEEYWHGPLLKSGVDSVLLTVSGQSICRERVPSDFALGELVQHYDPSHFAALPRQAACLLPAVQAVGIGSTGQLTLVQADKRCWSLRFSTHSLRWMLDATEHAGELRHYRRLDPVPVPPGVGYTLRCARWENGTRLFVDSRGLLHLIAADLQMPQISIVLVTDQPLGCWASDDTVCGPIGYTGRAGLAPRDFQQKITALLSGVA